MTLTFPERTSSIRYCRHVRERVWHPVRLPLGGERIEVPVGGWTWTRASATGRLRDPAPGRRSRRLDRAGCRRGWLLRRLDRDELHRIALREDPDGLPSVGDRACKRAGLYRRVVPEELANRWRRSALLSGRSGADRKDRDRLPGHTVEDTAGDHVVSEAHVAPVAVDSGGSQWMWLLPPAQLAFEAPGFRLVAVDSPGDQPCPRFPVDVRKRVGALLIRACPRDPIVLGCLSEEIAIDLDVDPFERRALLGRDDTGQRRSAPERQVDRETRRAPGRNRVDRFGCIVGVIDQQTEQLVDQHAALRQLDLEAPVRVARRLGKLPIRPVALEPGPRQVERELDPRDRPAVVRDDSALDSGQRILSEDQRARENEYRERSAISSHGACLDAAVTIRFPLPDDLDLRRLASHHGHGLTLDEATVAREHELVGPGRKSLDRESIAAEWDSDAADQKPAAVDDASDDPAAFLQSELGDFDRLRSHFHRRRHRGRIPCARGRHRDASGGDVVDPVSALGVGERLRHPVPLQPDRVGGEGTEAPRSTAARARVLRTGQSHCCPRRGPRVRHPAPAGCPRERASSSSRS